MPSVRAEHCLTHLRKIHGNFTVTGKKLALKLFRKNQQHLNHDIDKMIVANGHQLHGENQAESPKAKALVIDTPSFHATKHEHTAELSQHISLDQQTNGHLHLSPIANTESPTKLTGDLSLPNGKTNVPNGETNVPNGKTNVPNGEINVPNGEINVPNGETDVPNGETDVPNGETDVPNGKTDVPNGETDDNSIVAMSIDSPRYACECKYKNLDRMLIGSHFGIMNNIFGVYADEDLPHYAETSRILWKAMTEVMELFQEEPHVAPCFLAA